MKTPDKTRETVLRRGVLFIHCEIALTLSKACRFWCLFLQACRHGNIWPNLTEMCSHRSACRLKCLDTHTVTFLYLLAVKNRCGTPSTTTQSSHQASTGKQTDSSAIQLTNICMHTHTPAHTHTLSQRWEAVLKLWQTVQPAEAIHGELFCSVVWCCFSN